MANEKPDIVRLKEVKDQNARRLDWRLA